MLIDSGKGLCQMVWVILAAVLALLLFSYIYQVAPYFVKRKRDYSAFRVTAFAHRGLHNAAAGIPENSLAAFQRAKEKGYGVELDVYLTADNHLVVHHDRSLKRICGMDRNIDQMTLEEIRKFSLSGTDEKIPTLDEVLSLIDGRIPIIIEMKSDRGRMARALPPILHQRMQRYQGPYCVESFDPVTLAWYKKYAPEIVRGQLCYDQKKMEGKKKSLFMFFFAHLFMNLLSRPDFLAYEYRSRRNITFRLVAKIFRPLLVAWTIKDQKTYDQMKAIYDWQIFEGFEPESL